VPSLVALVVANPFFDKLFLLPIPSRFNHSIKDWRSRQMWLFVLCQEHSTDINYQCQLHWHPIKTYKIVDRLFQDRNSFWVRKRIIHWLCVHSLFTIKFVVAAFTSAAIVNYHKTQDHQNLDFSGFCQSPVAICTGGYRAHKESFLRDYTSSKSLILTLQIHVCPWSTYVKYYQSKKNTLGSKNRPLGLIRLKSVTFSIDAI
jgi:hypothetical protein